MKHTFTHKGIKRDTCAPVFDSFILLRQTKRYWVGKSGTKFRKIDGSIPNASFRMSSMSLDIKTVIKLETQESLTQAVG